MYTLNSTEVHAICYGISPYHSNAICQIIRTQESMRQRHLKHWISMVAILPVIKGVYVSLKYITIENHPNDSRVKIKEDGICQSLTGRMGTGGQHANRINNL